MASASAFCSFRTFSTSLATSSSRAELDRVRCRALSSSPPFHINSSRYPFALVFRLLMSWERRSRYSSILLREIMASSSAARRSVTS